MPFILAVLSFEDVPAGPDEDSKSMFLVVLVVTLILVDSCDTVAALPPALSLLQTVPELSNIARTIARPGVLAFAMRLAFCELTLVSVSTSKYVHSSSMLQTLLPLAFVPVTIFPLVYSVALCLGVSPLADVGVEAV
jgi:hypothetical protein